MKWIDLKCAVSLFGPIIVAIVTAMIVVSVADRPARIGRTITSSIDAGR